ncbi:20680_t:CDS:2 [Gigaspora margarita]|uniref:20680_t:CDS:1 n=1 Tax=Gigaspora margarita TaxID=4874 RepID=A0ABN7UHH9_GIGMA|nr:20680_t:CDS:2 [Gigaspora margarita]
MKDDIQELQASLQLDYKNSFLKNQLDMPQKQQYVNTKDQQIVNKKIRYVNGFGKIKKALNTALDLGCEKELINIITYFINQKVFIYEN